MSPTTRRIVALVCIAALILIGVVPAASHVAVSVLVPLDPLFGLVVVAQVPPADDIPVGIDPVLVALTPRAPPVA